MYGPLKRTVLALFKAPSGPPPAPAGAHDSVRVLRASPKYLTYRMLPIGCGGAVLGLFLAAGLVGVLASGEAVVLLVPAGIVVLGLPALLLGYFCTRVDYELRYYVLTDRSVRVREGAWLVDERTITFANVQNVRVEQGPLQRLLGFSNVRVDTAGGGAPAEHPKHGGAGGHGVVLAGIENAAEVRDLVLEHLRRRGKGAGLGDLDDERRSLASLAAHLAELRETAGAAAALRRAAEATGR
jgi:membrane protein YdbS with pleckstrin-like domain